MKEIPNPLHAINFITDGFTSRIVNKLLGMHPLEKLNSLFPNKKSIKKDHQLKKLKKILNKTTPVVTDKSEIKKSRPLEAYIARDTNEVKEAQALRYKVFAEELGARLPFNSENLDIDEFDQYCDHLIVRDKDSLMVIGTYRILPPEQAKLIGKVYSANEFDLSRIEHLLPKAVEVGRSCVHPNYRSGAVIMALWAGLGSYMRQHGYEILLGCASVPMADGGHYAASLNRIFYEANLCPVEYRTFPKVPLPLDKLNTSLEVDPPALIKGYLRLGAQICGEPAWDPDFNTADFLTMLRLSDINPKYGKHFLNSN